MISKVSSTLEVNQSSAYYCCLSSSSGKFEPSCLPSEEGLYPESAAAMSA